MIKNKNLIQSFQSAIKGLKDAFIRERGFRIMVIVALVTGLVVFYLPFKQFEKIIVWLAIFLVLTFELLNTLIERIMDCVFPEYDERARYIKDISAGLVFLICLAATVIGFGIFGSFILRLVQSFLFQ